VLICVSIIANSGVPSKRKVRELQRLLDILPTCIAVSVKQGELSTHAVGCQLDVGVSTLCQFTKQLSFNLFVIVPIACVCTVVVWLVVCIIS
jgi:hypothetical protein